LLILFQQLQDAEIRSLYEQALLPPFMKITSLSLPLWCTAH